MNQNRQAPIGVFDSGVVADEKIEELKKVLTEEEFISIWNDPKERKKVRISWKWF